MGFICHRANRIDAGADVSSAEYFETEQLLYASAGHANAASGFAWLQMRGGSAEYSDSSSEGRSKTVESMFGCQGTTDLGEDSNPETAAIQVS